ncbi:MAG TPA: ParA family protein [Candidatus Binataceae bacterium]|nr:ParA family protein [Candidatus Binataceae bacterium]
MHKIALIAQKGGVGKTTIAVNLAVSLQKAKHRTALFDLDQQENAVIWADRRGDEAPHVEFITDRRLPDAIAAAEKQGFAYSIIDTPPAAGPQAYTAAEAADLVIVPCRLSALDLDAIPRTAKLIRSVTVPAFVVFNAVPPTATTLIEEGRALAEKSGLECAPVVLRERKEYKAGWLLGKAVIETDPKSKAAGEIAELQKWVFAQLKVCTPAKLKVANG